MVKVVTSQSFNATNLFSGLASLTSIFSIGLVSGATGGLLLGVIVLQSLEFLADNRRLKEQLQKCLTGNVFFYYVENNNWVYDIKITIFAEICGIFSLILSLAVGICIGLFTYSQVIKKLSEAIKKKVLDLAGTLCLMGVAATAYLLGLF